MNKILVLITFIFLPIQTVFSQSQIVQELSEAVTDLTGSFMDNPNHHDNTLKIYEHSQKFNEVVEEMLDQAPYGSRDYYALKNMQKILKSLEHVSAGISEKYPASVDGSDFEFFSTLFDSFGWSKVILHSTSDIILYEYSKGNFRLVMAYNIRPKLNRGDYNEVSYQCYARSRYTKKDEMFFGRVLFGGNYQFVVCGDDTIPYIKITKVTSKRGSNF